MSVLPYVRRGNGEPVLVMMPFLSGSSQEWVPVMERLKETSACVGVDLPGFGDAAEVEGYTVAEMAESVAATVQAAGLERFVLVGHSMAGKVSAVLARWAKDGDERLRGLEGLVLVAPSPAGPEPMPGGKREEMLEALGGKPREGERGERKDRQAAERYIRENAAGDLPEELFEGAVRDVLRMNRAAWRAWLEGGSKEDWAERVGVLTLPVLLVAGDKDEALGTEVQRTVGMPHWANGRLASLHSNHLIPMEKPVELARLIAEFVEGLNGDGVRAERSMEPVEVAVPEEYVGLLLSDRVSPATRGVLEKRAEAEDPGYQPQALTVVQLAQLRALVDRVLPQRGRVSDGGGKIDLGARIDQMLAEGKGDGWRHAELPRDAEAYAAGLETLDWFAREEWKKGWLALDGEQRDALLLRVSEGKLGRGLLQRLEGMVGGGAEGEPVLGAEQMSMWFEEVRGTAARLYMAHPATYARVGYSGIGDGGDSAHQTGFVLIGEGEREAWEPLPTVPTAAPAGGAR